MTAKMEALESIIESTSLTNSRLQVRQSLCFEPGCLSVLNTCLFGSVNDRERMCDMFIGVFIHSIVRAMCDDDD